MPRRAAFEHEPESAAGLPAGCQALAGRPGVLHGRQATLKDEHPSPTNTLAAEHHPVFNTLYTVMCPFSFGLLCPLIPLKWECTALGATRRLKRPRSVAPHAPRGGRCSQLGAELALSSSRTRVWATQE